MIVRTGLFDAALQELKADPEYDSPKKYMPQQYRVDGRGPAAVRVRELRARIAAMDHAARQAFFPREPQRCSLSCSGSAQLHPDPELLDGGASRLP